LNLPAAVLVLCTVPLGIILLGRVARAFGWKTVLVLMPALFCTVALGFHTLSRPAVGVITGKTETLELSNRGLLPNITHRLVLTVAARSGRDTGLDSDQFDVDELVYDAATEGERVPLHCLTLGPMTFARLDALPWWHWVQRWLQSTLPVLHLGKPVLARARILSARTVSDAYVYSWASLLDQGTAHIVLQRPYDEIEISFSNGTGGTIRTLDRIDAGSAGTLTSGRVVWITYPTDRPRRARLTDGTREFAHINLLNYWLSQGLVIGVILVAAGLAEAARRALARHRRGRGTST
jgi:hypothetical protein